MGRSSWPTTDRLPGTSSGRLPNEERTDFLHALGRDAHQVTDADLDYMLQPDGLASWRERLTTAWLIGIGGRTQFRSVLADLLLESELTYAGQGYALAITRFGEPADADILTAYLDRYLPQPDCHYDQDWALGGLMHLDAALGSTHAARFLEPDGPWSRSSFSDRAPARCHSWIAELIDYADLAARAEA
ncbi:DUF6000 family protein [Nonomuraea sp. GTA35]|uniref:DUF6000 family protein n=1 Tax=Nonomuraea sp. GTA35 TaxID=1676746 RepID=UPI0035BF6604